MPTRLIKESCRTSPNLQRLSDFAERLFWRMLTTADDFGRCYSSPAIVRANCFPLSESISLKKIEMALSDLVQHHLIICYVVGDREYAQFRTFEKHQGNPRAKSSKFPAHTSLSASRCGQMQTVPDMPASAPDTDTDTDTDLNILSSVLNQNPDLKSKNLAEINLRNYREESKIILAFLNEKTGKKFREVEANLSLIEARLRSGVELQTCRTLVMRKVRDWRDDAKMARYLRPETLFNRTKFETYLAEVSS